MPITGIITAFFWVKPSLYELIILISIGITTHIAQFFLTKAYQKEKPENLAVYNHLIIFIACITGYLIFNETLSLQQVSGLAIIIFSILISSLKNFSYK